LKVDPVSVERRSLSEVLANPQLKAQIECIAAENYSNPDVLLEQEFTRNSHIYLYREDEIILGFSMVGWATASAACLPDSLTVYHGLTTISLRRHGLGIGKALWSAFLKDLETWKQQNSRSVNFWFFTASAVVMNSYRRLIPSLSPSPDGSYGNQDRHIIGRIVETSGLANYRCPTHPFVFRGVARARYSDSESKKLKTYQSTHTKNLLDDLGVDESRGDRVIFVGRLDHGRVIP
jgi:hypothetical protein